MLNGLKTQPCLVLALVIFLSITYTGMRGTILKSFVSLEQQEMIEDVGRCRNLISSELLQLATTAGDYGGWDEACHFVQSGDPAFVKTNLSPAIFGKLRLNLMAYTDRTGKIIYFKLLDYRSGERRRPSRSLLAQFTRGKGFLAHDSNESSIAGLVPLPEGLMLVASRPVLTSDFKGPIKGAVVMGRYLDEGEIRRLADIVKLDMTFARGPAPRQEHLTLLPDGSPVHIRPQGADTIVGQAVLRDIHGSFAGLIQVTEARPIFSEGKNSVNRLFLLTAIISAIFTSIVAKYIHDAKRLENNLRSLNAELDRRVHERTAELVRLNKELESYNYSISHELRAPIARIDGFTRVITETVAEGIHKEVAYSARRIAVSVQRMRVVVDGLLLMNRISRMCVEREPVNLTAMAQEIVEELLEGAGPSKLKVHIAQDMVAQGHPYMLDILLRNLLGNALKYTAKATDATIEFGHTTLSGTKVYFVRDNGAGFDMGFVDKLFKPFSRLHSDDEFEGTGIGLATVQRIVDRHGGKIWAEAAPGKGATFYFTLGEEYEETQARRVDTAGGGQ